jgi:hypothetical protein
LKVEIAGQLLRNHPQRVYKARQEEQQTQDDVNQEVFAHALFNQNRHRWKENRQND